MPVNMNLQLCVGLLCAAHMCVLQQIQEAGTSSPQVSTTATEDITWQFFNTSSSGIGKNMLLGTASRCVCVLCACERVHIDA